MKQNQSIIGKECIIGQNFPQIPTTKEWNGIDVKSTFGKLKDLFAEAGLPVVDMRYNIDKNTINVECSSKAYTPMKGLILDVQGDIAIIALKNTHEMCAFKTAKDDTPKGAYIPEAWEMLKYCTRLQKYWPTGRVYWSSQLSYQGSDCSDLYYLGLYSDDCYVYDSNVDSYDRLYTGYFIKVPINSLEIVK